MTVHCRGESVMKDVSDGQIVETVRDAGRWQELADRVLEGHRLTEEEGLAILRSDDLELLELLAAAYRVRHHYHGNRVYLNFLMNAKSGRLRRGLCLLLSGREGHVGYSRAMACSIPTRSSPAPRWPPSAKRPPTASSLPAEVRARKKSTASPKLSRGSSPRLA